MSAPPEYPGRARNERVLHAAALLAAMDVDFVVVGSAAEVLRGVTDSCRDLDVVPDPERENVDRLRDALVRIGASALGRVGDVRTVTSPFGSIDVMFETARREYPALLARAGAVERWGVPIRVAALDDVVRLRSWFSVGTG